MPRHTHLSVPNAEFAALIAGQPSQSLPEDLIAVREVFKTVYAKGMQEHFGSTLPLSKALPINHLFALMILSILASEYSVQDYSVPVGDASDEILVRCLVPSSVNKPGKTFPLLVWYHGGGHLVSLSILTFKL